MLMLGSNTIQALSKEGSAGTLWFSDGFHQYGARGRGFPHEALVDLLEAGGSRNFILNLYQ